MTAPTLGSLAADGATVQAWCLVCRHTATWSAGDLARAHGEALPFPAFKARLTCQCGARRAHAAIRPGPPKDAAPAGPSAAANGFTVEAGDGPGGR